MSYESKRWAFHPCRDCPLRTATVDERELVTCFIPGQNLTCDEDTVATLIAQAGTTPTQIVMGDGDMLVSKTHYDDVGASAYTRERISSLTVAPLQETKVSLVASWRGHGIGLLQSIRSDRRANESALLLMAERSRIIAQHSVEEAFPFSAMPR